MSSTNFYQLLEYIQNLLESPQTKQRQLTNIQSNKITNTTPVERYMYVPSIYDISKPFHPIIKIFDDFLVGIQPSTQGIVIEPFETSTELNYVALQNINTADLQSLFVSSDTSWEWCEKIDTEIIAEKLFLASAGGLGLYILLRMLHR